MTEQNPFQQPDARQAAPIAPLGDGFDEYREPPGWPKVVGIISIVWASLGLVCGGCFAVFSVVGQGMMPPEARDQMPPMSMLPLQWVQMGIASLLGLLLIVGGSMTIARRPLGRTLHLVYAIGSLLLLPFGLYLQVQANARIDQWALDNPTLPAAKNHMASGSVGKMVGYAIGGFLGAAYPIFLLIWFGAIKRRPQDMGAVREVV